MEGNETATMDVIQFKGINLEIQMERVLDSLKCTKDNPSYEQVKSELGQVLVQVKKVYLPRGYYRLSEKVLESGFRECLCLVTLGRRAEELGALYFRQGEYLKGVLTNTVADYLLFALDEVFQRELELFLKKQNLIIVERLEFPCTITLEQLKKNIEGLGGESITKVRVTESGMLSPAKSMSYLYRVEENAGNFNETGIKHNCATCSVKACMYRKQ